MKIPDCTLVTAIYDLSKFNKKSRPFEESIKNIKSLLETPCYLIIYSDSVLMPEIKKIRQQYEFLTVYKEVPIEEIWTFKYIDKIKNNREKYWPTKDERTCSENHALVCNKFDFVLKVIDENPFNTSKFGWIDAHAEKICEDYRPIKLLNILSQINDKFRIQILNVVDKKYKLEENKKEYYETYRWLVCGCLFTCGKEIGKKILERLKENFIFTTNLGFGHGEEMLYLEIFDEFFDDIERSYGDYKQIINNFTNVTLNADYVYHNILKKYQNMNYPKEMYYCAKELIKQIDNYNIWMSPNIHMDILFCYYLGSFYYKPFEAKGIVDKIKNDCKNYPLLNNIYLGSKEYYDKQFRFVDGRNENIILLINGNLESFETKKAAIDYLSK